jgi:choline kinase
MSKIQGLILAAGRGSRLGKAGEEQPKPLLQIGRRHLIEHQLDALAESGVGPVHVVIGYAADEVRELVGMRAEFIHNNRWASTNSLYSWWVSRDTIDGDVLVLNCDVLFSADVIARLLEEPGDAIAIDTSSGAGREQMKVGVVDGRVVRMSKDLEADETGGENVGILKLTAETARVLFDKAGELIEAGGETSWIGSSIAAVARQRNFRAVDVAGLPWVEIDFPVDLARARKEVWPAIRGGAHRRRRLWRIAAGVLGVALVGGALLMGRLWSATEAPPPADWESIPIATLAPARVDLGERSQGWWVLETGAVAEARVTGPGPLRLESRLLDVRGERVPYVLEATLDDRLLDYYRIVTRPSGKATHPRWIVGRKKRVTEELGDGTHLLRLRLLAPDGATCLVRVRQLEAPGDE